jgi:hypothetical protein
MQFVLVSPYNYFSGNCQKTAPEIPLLLTTKMVAEQSLARKTVG